MAPIRPSKSRGAIVGRQSSTSSTQRPRSLDDPYKLSPQRNKAPTKAHKRSVKHANLLSRLQRTTPSSKITKKRRPSKKLVTTLEGLEGALPTTSLNKEGSEDRTQPAEEYKQKSLKSRPGALKRKEKLLTAERDRFAKNLALMAMGPTDKIRDAGSSGTTVNETSDNTAESETFNGNRARWAAIRDHIGRTMETTDSRDDSR